MRSVYVSTAPTVEPVTVEEAKVFCRIDTTDDDVLITSLIKAAREASEHYTGRAYITQTLKYVLDTDSRFLPLPKPPFSAVSTVKYLNSTKTWTTMVLNTDYYADTRGQSGVVTLLTSPTVDERGLATVEITYTAGYGAAATAVPYALKQAVLMRIATLYENRVNVGGSAGQGIPENDAKALEAPYRVLTVGTGE